MLDKKIIQEKNLGDYTSDAIITIGTRVTNENTNIKKYIESMITKDNCEFIYMHPIDNISLQDKYTQFIKYEAGSEEGVMALLSFFLVTKAPDAVQDYLEDLDIGNLSGESSVGEEELEFLVEKFQDKKEITFIIGEDVFSHDRILNIKKMIQVLHLYTNIRIVLLNENTIDVSDDIILEEVDDMKIYNGSVMYTVPADTNILKGSASFAMAAKIKNNDMVTISYLDDTVEKQFLIDPAVRGTIALFPLEKKDEETSFKNGYKFKQIKIQKVDL